MRLTYNDGTSGDDYLFDQPEDLHRVYIAGCMNLNSDTPGAWPIKLIDKLLWIRRHEGLKAFHAELRRILSRTLPETLREQVVRVSKRPKKLNASHRHLSIRSIGRIGPP